jgi:hypothetical protein
MTDLLLAPAPPTTAPEPPHKSAIGGKLKTLAATILLPLSLFTLLQPETFGLAPNALDPFFYTGLGVNFDDASKVGASWYFITRWSAWYPLFLADVAAGPFVGRLVLRLIMVAAIVGGLWRLRPEWSWSQRILSATILITMPMFVRPLMTDYVEYAILVFGMLLVILSLGERPGWAAAAGAGVLVALLGVANPFAVTAAILPLCVMVFLQTTGWGRRILLSIVIVTTMLAVLMGGLFYFRWFYGIPNLYRPTVDYLREGTSPDGLKSPSLEWLGAFTWLYVPPILAAAAAIASVRPSTRLDRREWIAVGMAMLHYLIHWVDQFVRNGDGLEISYYWSMSFTTLGVALALVCGRLATGIGRARTAILVIGWIGLLRVGVPQSLHFPAGIGFFVLAALALGGFALLLPRLPATALAVFAALVLWTQIGAPAYDPTTYHPYNTSPRYEYLFGANRDASETAYREAIWFEREMDRLPRDSEALFLPVSSWGSPIVGIYHAHVGEQLERVDTETGALDSFHRFGLMANTHPWLVVFGEPVAVADQLARSVNGLGLGPPVIDETHDRDLGYRLVAIPLPPTPRLPLSIPAAELPVQNGIKEGGAVVASGTMPGFVTFGPYLLLAPDRYVVTLDYSAAAPLDAPVGTFDAFNGDVGQAASVSLPGTDGRTATIELAVEIEADGKLWEFRSQTNATSDLRIESIQLRLDR